MVRPRIGYAMMGAGIAVAVVGAMLLVDKLVVGTAVAFGVAMLLLYGGAIVAARAGTAEERKRRQGRAERSAATLGMAMAKLSGGWTPRRRERKPPQRGNRSD
jgi:hypothetical protein